MRKSKSFWIKVTAIVVAVALIGGTGLFLLFNRNPVIRIASRLEIIELWEEQGITSWFENELNVRIEWVDYGDETDEIYRRVIDDLQSSYRDLPDIYLGLGLTQDQIRVLMAQDTFLSFEHMAEEHAPNLQAIINQDTDRAAEFLLNGSMITFPSFYEQYSDSFPQKAWVNAQWLQRVEMSLPTTPQQLLELLRAFQELNDNDEPVLGAAYAGSPANMTTLGFLIHAFVTTDFDLHEISNYLNVENGEIYAGVVRPAYRDALRFLNQLYSEGLMDSEVFTQGPEVFLGGALNDERYGVILARDLNALFNDAERAAGFIPLPPLSNNGHRSTLVRGNEISVGGFMIPARIDLDRQHLALRFGDAMLSGEATDRILSGGENMALYNSILGGIPFWMDARLQLESQMPQDGNLQTSENWQIYLNAVARDYYAPVGRMRMQNILPALVPNAEDMASLNLDGVIQYITEASREFVTGDRNIETDWDAYVARLNELGLRDIIQMMQTALEREE